MNYKVERRLADQQYCVKSYTNPTALAHDIADRWVLIPFDSNAGKLLTAARGLPALGHLIAATLFNPGFMTPCPDCDSDQVPCVCDIGG